MEGIGEGGERVVGEDGIGREVGSNNLILSNKLILSSIPYLDYLLSNELLFV